MTSNQEHFNFPQDMDKDIFMLNGKPQCLEVYRGCPDCPETWEMEIYFEQGCKSKKKYPLRAHYLNTSPPAQHIKNLENQLQVSEDIDSEEDLVKTPIDVKRLEETIRQLEQYTATFKSKLRKYKEKENCMPLPTRLKQVQVNPLEFPSINNVNSANSEVGTVSDDEEVAVVMERTENVTTKTLSTEIKHAQSPGSDSPHPEEETATISNPPVITSEASHDDITESPDNSTQEANKEDEVIEEATDFLMETSPTNASEEPSSNPSI